MRRGTLWWWWWCPAPPPGVKQVELSARSSCDQLPFREQKRVTTPAKHLLLYYSSPANRIMNRTCKICPSLVKIKKSLGTLGTLADLRQFYLRVECFLTAVVTHYLWWLHLVVSGPCPCRGGWPRGPSWWGGSRPRPPTPGGSSSATCSIEHSTAKLF